MLCRYCFYLHIFSKFFVKEFRFIVKCIVFRIFRKNIIYFYEINKNDSKTYEISWKDLGNTILFCCKIKLFDRNVNLMKIFLLCN